MQANELPTWDMSDSPTGCCPRFHPEGWDRQQIELRDKPFVRASTVSFFHIEQIAKERGRTLETLYFFYTPCPKCAKAYGKNYVVGFAKVKA